MAKTTDHPNIAISDENYLKWQALYVKCSDEKDKVEQALKKIIEAIPSKKMFMDIGAGDGDLTFRIKKYFEKTIVVEPNRATRKIFETSGIDFVEDCFPTPLIAGYQFDLILCSHVFWLVNKDKRKEFISKAHSHLTKDGVFVVITSAPRGQGHEFHRRFFYGYDMSSKEISQDIDDLGLSSETISVTSSFQTANFEDFFSICKLFVTQSWLHPANIDSEDLKRELGDLNEYTRVKLGEIAEYIKKLYFDGIKYSMKTEIDVIIIRK